jgi:hypothetical protein
MTPTCRPTETAAVKCPSDAPQTAQHHERNNARRDEESTMLDPQGMLVGSTCSLVQPALLLLVSNNPC